ncbi:SMI1/KNR4 family protein [Emticicia fontis]
MNQQLERIKEKLEQLKRLDKRFIVFGSQKHRYKLNQVISSDKIQQFENTYKITLPAEYVAFMTTIGNGGAGPCYGLEPFENCLFDDLDYKSPDSLLNPSKPFLHTQPWNMEFIATVDEKANEAEYWKERTAFEEQYFAKEQMNGTIAICNCGCALNLNLVINGEEFGNIWIDDRGSDNGIFPSSELENKDRTTFLDWYELWLDNSLNEMKEKQLLNKKPWWKIW